MKYRDIAIEAVDALSVLCDFVALSMTGHKPSSEEASRITSLMILAPRRLRHLIEQEDRAARFMREVDEWARS